MPADNCRTYPARSSSRWLATSASAGSSRNVGMNNLLQNMFFRKFSHSSIGQSRSKHRGRLHQPMVKSESPDMKIAIAADHAGFALKERLRQRLTEEGHEVVDFGTGSTDSCDYPDYAQQVAREVGEGRSERGILVCSTGIGM